jgi:hypothetical protein
MNGVPKVIMTLVVGLFLAGIVGYYGYQTFAVDSAQKAVQESMRSAVLNARDDSSRVEEGKFKLQQEKFETEFKALFVKNKNHSEANWEYEFSYLMDGSYTKAVKVKVLNGEKVYQATTVVSLGEDI